MIYAKNLRDRALADNDSWCQWLDCYAIKDLEYSLCIDQNQLTLEFFDWDRAQEFAQEFGL